METPPQQGPHPLPRLLLLLLALLGPLAARAAPPDAAAFAIHQHPGAPIPIDAPLNGPEGPTTLRQLARGRPTLLLLGYFHCPNLCGPIRDDVFNALARATTPPGAYSLAILSIDPGETRADAEAARTADQDRFPAETGTYLTGNAAPIAEAAGYPSRWDNDANQFLHPAGLVLLTPAGTVSSYVLGLGYDPAALDRALAQATAGTIAAPANPILLLCFHFDDTTGQYTLAVTKLLRLAAAATVLAILAGLALAYRRRRT